MPISCFLGKYQEFGRIFIGSFHGQFSRADGPKIGGVSRNVFIFQQRDILVALSQIMLYCAFTDSDFPCLNGIFRVLSCLTLLFRRKILAIIDICFSWICGEVYPLQNVSVAFYSIIFKVFSVNLWFAILLLFRETSLSYWKFTISWLLWIIGLISDFHGFFGFAGNWLKMWLYRWKWIEYYEFWQGPSR